jgi:hypothetical protein
MFQFIIRGNPSQEELEEDQHTGSLEIGEEEGREGLLQHYLNGQVVFICIISLLILNSTQLQLAS